MDIYISRIIIIFILLISVFNQIGADLDEVKLPTVFIAILVRNKAPALPYFLSLLSRIEYPKKRIALWIRTDHNEDNSVEILSQWVKNMKTEYHFIELEVDNSSKKFQDEGGIAHWSDLRYRHVIELRENALNLARDNWADYIWFLDCDSFITNPSTLKTLVRKQKTVVAPMLLSDTMYSNFWCGMTANYYYKRTEDYEKILNRENIGCFQVPMVHSAVLINLRSPHSDVLTYSPSKVDEYSGPIDDIIIFAVGANKSNVSLHICNDLNYGYTPVPLEETQSFDDDRQNLVNLKLFITVDESPLPVDPLLYQYVSFPEKKTFGFDKIFVINLKRRKERRDRMQYCLDELGIDATFVEAVDGRALDDEQIKEMGITLLKGYEDPYHKRPMKHGEIGCFLSHYKLWNKMLSQNFEKILILEDDVRFEKFFISKLQNLIIKSQQISVPWELIYVGRKIMNPKKETLIEGSDILVYPDYTYWTLGYILNRKGAEKLVRANPLKNLLPVDEFLPIMYDRHPRDDWKSHFPKRDLKALSVNPLIIFPVKYINEVGYVSDTENSEIVKSKDSIIDEL